MAFSSQFKRPESTIFQSSYLQTIQNKGHTTTANLHSKLAIWTLVWMVKNGTPKSSSICLLPCHQGALVARWKHLECYIWSLPTWLQAANPVCGKCSPSWDGWAICTAGLHSWWRDHFSFSGEDTTLPEFRKIYFWLDRYESMKSGVYLRLPSITWCVDTLDWLTEKLTVRVLRIHLSALSNVIMVLYETLMAYLHSFKHRSGSL